MPKVKYHFTRIVTNSNHSQSSNWRHDWKRVNAVSYANVVKSNSAPATIRQNMVNQRVDSTFQSKIQKVNKPLSVLKCTHGQPSDNEHLRTDRGLFTF